MKYIGFFIVVFGGFAASKILGFSDYSCLFGTIVSGGTYILMSVK